jgi:RNA polymerase sigma-70 factor (ECF subfamily)
MQISQILEAPSVEEQCRQCLAAGDPERLLTILMSAYGRDLHRYAWGMLRHEQLAEDVLQNVFIQAYEDVAAFEGRSTFRTWLFGITRHRCLDEIRRRSRWARVVDEEAPITDMPSGASATDRDTELRALAIQLEGCLDDLSDDIREIVLLRFRQDLSYDDIAAVTGDSPGALRVRVCRSLTALRRCLEHKGARF